MLLRRSVETTFAIIGVEDRHVCCPVTVGWRGSGFCSAFTQAPMTMGSRFRKLEMKATEKSKIRATKYEIPKIARTQ